MLSDISTCSDDTIKRFIKQLIFKRIISGKPSIVPPSSPIPSFLFIQPENIISLTDVIYTTSLSEYGMRTLPMPASCVVVENDSDTDGVNTCSDNNLSTAIIKLINLLFVPAISDSKLFQKIFIHIVRYRKSYIQFVDNVQTLLSKHKMHNDIHLLLMSRIEECKQLLV
jgi:hypothetical protein